MKIRILGLPAAMAGVILMVAGCIAIHGGHGFAAVYGNGEMVKEKRDLAPFNRVRVEGFGKVVIKQGKPHSVEVNTDGNILGSIDTVVEDGELAISQSGGVVRPTKLKCTVVMENLAGVSVSGSADVKGRNRFSSNTFHSRVSGSGEITVDVDAESMELAISGSGSIRVSGSAETLAGSIEGSGNIDAMKLKTRVSTITINGSGDCRVAVAEALTAVVNGSGDVEYRGNPEVNTTINGSGTVRKKR